MNIVIKVGGHCLNVDSVEDAERLIEQGGIALSEEEIVRAGMSGYEHLVSPLNATVREDGVVVFTPPQPSQPTIEDHLAAIEAEYAQKIAALQTALVAATLAGGSIMDGNIASLRTEWAVLLNAKSAAMEALLV